MKTFTIPFERPEYLKKSGVILKIIPLSFVGLLLYLPAYLGYVQIQTSYAIGAFMVYQIALFGWLFIGVKKKSEEDERYKASLTIDSNGLDIEYIKDGGVLERLGLTNQQISDVQIERRDFEMASLFYISIKVNSGKGVNFKLVDIALFRSIVEEMRVNSISVGELKVVSMKS